MSRKGVQLPKHRDSIRHGRVASAPYNFIPLPELVVEAVDSPEGLPDHDVYHAGAHTGYLDVILAVRSPLYIRAPFALPEFLRQEHKDETDTPYREQVRNKPDFFYTSDQNEPVIPGSSLRGMLRGLLEIASYGKVGRLSDKRLFFRTVDDTAVGLHYRGRLAGVETGFIRRERAAYVIRACQVARVPREMLPVDLYEGRGPRKTPCWAGDAYQGMPVWVSVGADARIVTRMETKALPGLDEGRLVITGDVPGKKREFVFLMPGAGAEEIQVPNEMIERFHDEDQITQWQERAFPKDRPGRNSRGRSGQLQKGPRDQGDPVFFLREDGRLTFFGRAQMFRLPYRQRPIDLVPSDLRRPSDIDYAEAMFGFAKGSTVDAPQGSKARAYAGRVFVTDAAVVGAPEELWLSDDPITPRVLATPKPTAFQHYLVQQDEEKSRLRHYDSPSPSETAIRGHKRYWHQGLGDGLSPGHLRKAIEEEAEPAATDTQHTQFRPLKPGVQFAFRVYFENLSNRELGALCWTLHPLGAADGDGNKDYCHHLGMGKPLGMGAVKLEATLHLTERRKRYGGLFNGNSWETGAIPAGQSLADRAVLEALTREFERHVLEQLKPSKSCEHLYELRRIGMLLKMLEWPGFPPELPARPDNRFLQERPGRPGRPNTRYMSIQLPGVPSSQRNEYRDRPVLPDPSMFGSLTGDAEPAVVSAPGRPVMPTGRTAHPPHPPKPEEKPPVPTPPARARGVTKREWVVLVKVLKGDKALVRAESGEEIPCAGLPLVPPPEEQARFRADVTREGERAVEARFKGWR